MKSKKNEIIGGCSKHIGQRMIDCPLCDTEDYIHKARKLLNPMQSSKPNMLINESNSNWISHVINKKTKKAHKLELFIRIKQGSVFVSLVDRKDFRSKTISGHSSHDINEAISRVISGFATDNLMYVIDSMSLKKSPQKTAKVLRKNKVPIYEGKKLRKGKNDFIVGEKVVVVPEWTNKDKPQPKMKSMYVNEFDKKADTIGLSNTKKSKHIYGIFKNIVWHLPKI